MASFNFHRVVTTQEAGKNTCYRLRAVDSQFFLKSILPYFDSFQWFRFVSVLSFLFRFVSFRFVSFRFVSFRFVSLVSVVSFRVLVHAMY